MKREDIFKAVISERDRQDAKWGTTQTTLPRHQWMTILTEEVGEVAMAVNDGRPDQIREELIQVIAVAVKWLENRSA